MVRVLGAIVLAATLATGCASSSGSAPARSSTATSRSPSSPASSPSISGAADINCLVHGGAAWHISKPDMESQLHDLLAAKFTVNGVQIVGDETLTVTPGLQASWTDETTATISAMIPKPPMPMVMKQVHHGTATGAWKVSGDKLLPQGTWTGGLQTNTTMTIEGRTSSAPTTGSVGDLGNISLVFTCTGSSLKLTVPGTSPFVYVFG